MWVLSQLDFLVWRDIYHLNNRDAYTPKADIKSERQKPSCEQH
jgi:hypothetical protein